MTSKALSELGPAGRLSLENVDLDKPWKDAVRVISDARAAVGVLANHEYTRPGDRGRVGAALFEAQDAILKAAGAIEEARGLSRRVDAERIER